MFTNNQHKDNLTSFCSKIKCPCEATCCVNLPLLDYKKKVGLKRKKEK